MQKGAAEAPWLGPVPASIAKNTTGTSSIDLMIVGCASGGFRAIGRAKDLGVELRSSPNDSGGDAEPAEGVDGRRLGRKAYATARGGAGWRERRDARNRSVACHAATKLAAAAAGGTAGRSALGKRSASAHPPLVRPPAPSCERWIARATSGRQPARMLNRGRIAVLAVFLLAGSSAGASASPARQAPSPLARASANAPIEDDGPSLAIGVVEDAVRGARQSTGQEHLGTRSKP